MKNNLFKNILSNYIGKVWSFISMYIFIPLYIKYLGIEAYGVINFYTVLLSILLFADAGLSVTLSREFSRSDDKIYCRNLLFSIERLYILISVIIIASLWFFAPQIAANWLHADAIPQEKIALCIQLMGVSVAFQFFSTLHNSGLMGLQKQVLANTIQVSWSMARSGLVIVALYFSRDLVTFFYWQIASNIIFFLVNRAALWKQISFDSKPVFDARLLKDVSRFALGMMLMAIIASLNSQLDKLVVSKYLSLKEFSYYSLAGNLAQIPVLLINPLTISILPVLNRITKTQSNEELKKIFHQYSFLIAFLSSVIGLTLFFYAQDVAMLWTGNAETSTNIKSVSRILVLGSIFLSVQYMPYLLAIANGHTRTNLVLGVVCIFLLLPLLYFFIGTFGFAGAAYPFLLLNVLAFMVLGYLVIYKFLPGEFNNFILKDILTPWVINLTIIFIVFRLSQLFAYPYGVLLGTFVSGLLCLFVNLSLFRKLFPGNKINETLSKYFRTSGI